MNGGMFDLTRGLLDLTMPHPPAAVPPATQEQDEQPAESGANYSEKE